MTRPADATEEPARRVQRAIAQALGVEPGAVLPVEVIVREDGSWWINTVVRMTVPEDAEVAP